MASPSGSYRPSLPWTVASSDTLPTARATATSASSRSSSQRGRGRIGPSTRGSAVGRARRAAAGVRHVSARSSRIRTWPIWSSSPKPDRCDAVDPPPVDVRAVGAAEVLEVPATPAVRQDGVIGRRERVVDDDRVVDVSTERRDDVETERMARDGSPLGDSSTTSRPGRSAGSRAAARRSRSKRPDDPVRKR